MKRLHLHAFAYWYWVVRKLTDQLTPYERKLRERFFALNRRAHPKDYR